MTTAQIPAGYGLERVEHIRQCLVTAYDANLQRLQSASPTQWTDFYMDFFCDSRIHGSVATDACSKAPSKTHEAFNGLQRRAPKPYEFMFDLCWFPDWTFKPGCYSKELTQKLPLVLESENGLENDAVSSRNEVFYDFAKLVYARAAIKVMLFAFHRGVDTQSEFSAMADSMERSARATGDSDSTYLLVGSQFAWKNEGDEALRTRIFTV